MYRLTLRSTSRLAWRCLALAFALALVPAAGSAQSTERDGGQWPHFRGPQSTGVGIAHWPEQLALELAWKRPLGTGYSGLAVADGRLYTAYAADGTDWLAAFDAASGEELWRLDLGEAIPAFGGAHGGPLATPALGDGLVFAVGGNGRLVATGLDGEELWRRELSGWAEKPDFGFGSSPLVVEGEEGEVVVVQAPGGDGVILRGLDPATGEELWSLGDDQAAYQSPVVARVGGREQILVAGMGGLRGITPRGKTLWIYGYSTAGQPPSPKGRGSDVPLPLGADRVMVKTSASEVVAVEIRPEPGCDSPPSTGSCGLVAEEVWQSRYIARSYKPSVAADGIVYGHKGLILTALDAGDGKLLWGSRTPGDGFLAVADDRLLVLTKSGSLHIGRAGRDGWDEQAAIHVFEDDAWTEPTVVDDAIFVRSVGALARVEVHPADATELAEEGAEEWIDTSLPGAALPETRFGHFVRSLREVDDRSAAMEEFLAGVESFPIVEEEWAHFVYRGPEPAVGIAGDMLGERTELDMVRIPGTDVFYFTSRLPRDAWVAYLFRTGLEEDAGMLDPHNPRVTHWPREGSEFDRARHRHSYFTMPDYEPPAYLSGEPDDRGRVETHRIHVGDLDVEIRPPGGFASLDIPEYSPDLRIRVYLPPDYDPERPRPYPLVFVFAGGKMLEAVDAPQILDHLSGEELPAAVVVFIDRHYEFLAADVMWARELQSRAFFERVRPFVERTYRVGPEIHYLGFGFGGSIALRTAFDSRSAAERAAVVQPFLLDLLRPAYEKAASAVPQETRPSLYIESSRIDLRAAHETWDISVEQSKLAETLRHQGWDVTLATNSRGFAWEAWKDRFAPALAFVLTGEAEVPEEAAEAAAE